MTNKEFGRILENRTKDFARMLIMFSRSISKNLENEIIRKQVIRSGCSVGANYREANKARSKAEFLSKIKDLCR